MSPVEALIRSRIRRRGPLTVAEFMELALYHPEHGYYCSASRRTGRHGDYFTSADTGPLFGTMIAVQLEEMWHVLQRTGAERFDVVEVGAADGRLARDILDAAQRDAPALYARMRVTLVERSAAAREAQREMLAPHAARVCPAAESLPAHVTGVILANELLDALPIHVVSRSADGFCESYVAERDGALALVDGPVSCPDVVEELERSGVPLQEGVRAEVAVAAARWIEEAAATLSRGFLLLLDYGHSAEELHSAAHAGGTLLGYRRHTTHVVPWVAHAGECDITSHVNLTAVAAAAQASGLTLLGAVDQTYFLLALGLLDRLDGGGDARAVRRRLEARTLLMPGGLGSTMKVMAFGRNVGSPRLRGFSSGRLT